METLNVLQRLWRWQWGNNLTPRQYFGNLFYNSNIPILVDTANALKAYDECPHLQVVINKRAQMLSNGKWKCVAVDDDDEEFVDEQCLMLLKHPNILQNSSEWLYQYSLYHDIFSNNFMYPIRAFSDSLPAAIWHLPSEWMKVVPTGKVFKQTKIEDVIKEYILLTNATEEKYDVKDVIYKATNRSPVLGKSKIPGLTYPISNIIAALKTRNVIMIDKGAIGILSSEAGDADGGLPLKKKERMRIQNQMKQDRSIYSDQSKVVVTESALKWNPMSFPTKDLMLIEEVEDDFATIIAAYDLDRDIFPSQKGATFENKAAGMRSSYENGIEPTADDLAETMTKFFGLDLRGRKLILDYSHLAIMKSDEQTEAQGKYIDAQRASLLFHDGIISADEYAQMLGEEFTGDGEIKTTSPKPEPVVKPPKK